jgi:hypothetical protein
MGRPRVLAAVSRHSLPLLTELLGGWCELTPAFTIRDALAHAKRGEIEAVVIGLHFDGSRMPVLLEALRTDPATRDVPVVCCRLRPTMLLQTMRAARLVCEALDAAAFVDVFELRSRAGTAVAAVRVRSELRRALALTAGCTPAAARRSARDAARDTCREAGAARRTVRR